MKIKGDYSYNVINSKNLFYKMLTKDHKADFIANELLTRKFADKVAFKAVLK